jgi:hypothetical protein
MDIYDEITFLGKLERGYNRLQYVKARMDSYLNLLRGHCSKLKEYLKEKIAALADTNESLLDYLKRANDVLPEQYHMV